MYTLISSFDFNTLDLGGPDIPDACMRMPEICERANKYVRKHYPGFDTRIYPAMVSQSHGMWIVQYQLPRNWSGGTPVIVFRKSSGKIIAGFHSQ